MRQTILPILVLPLLLFLPVFAFEPLFDTRIDYPLASEGSVIISTDLNADGFADITVAPFFGTYIEISLNFGNGTFGPHSYLFTGYPVLSITCDDFDNDNDSDIAAMAPEDRKILIFLNDGHANFQLSGLYTIASYSSSICTADINDDDYKDLLVAASRVNRIFILQNQGGRSFSTEGSITCEPSPLSISASDIDNDSDDDVVVGGYSEDTLTASVEVFVNDGGGVFHPSQRSRPGIDVRSIRMADLNNDGNVDFAAACVVEDSIAIFINNGDTTFTQPVKYAADYYPRSIALSDLNDDGWADMAVVNHDADDLGIYMNNGDGTFESALYYFTGTEPRSISITDIDNDSHNDLIFVQESGKIYSTWKNMGSGNFPVPILILDSSNVNVIDVMAANFNCDELSDLICSIDRSQTAILINSGNGQFEIDSLEESCQGAKTMAGDFNGDGVDDLLSICNRYQNNIWMSNFKIYYNDGTGGFGSPDSILIWPGFVRNANLNDFNADGFCDFAFAPDSNIVNVVINNGDSTFGPPASFNYRDDNYGLDNINSAELTGDSFPELVLASTFNIYIMRNIDGRNFELIRTDTVNQSSQIQFIDFENDGDIDIISLFWSQNYIIRNLGYGIFAQPESIDFSPNSSIVQTSDINGDNLDDFIGLSGSGILTYLNEGGGFYQSGIGYGLGYHVGSKLAIGDFDGNGVNDIAGMVGATPRTNHHIIGILYNNAQISTIPININPVIPRKYILPQNYPNPFNARTVISYSLPKVSDVAIDIFDIMGRKIETISEGIKSAGDHKVIWDAKENSSGIYFYRIKAGEYSKTNKMVLMK